MYWDNGHMDGGWGFAMMLGMLGFWALIAVGIVWFVRSNPMATGSSAPEAPRSTTESAERILAERLARGDIDQAEYQSRLSALRS
ncbi:SHOCT domain-containing protein [Aeromicrobium sp. YC3-14]|nr:SHOCT domain-containing protein [Aeromicrobium stalagmiti]